MGRNKLQRFFDNESSNNVLQAGKSIFENIKNNWNNLHFSSTRPIVVELACGRGEFTVGLARKHPDKNFIGVDIKGSRIWKGSKTATEESLENVAFLRTQIELLDRFFGEHEISELWITFPDPRPREGEEKKRLTSPRFLDMYETLVKKRGLIHLKTDNNDLFKYTLEILQQRERVTILACTSDFYTSEFCNEHFGIQTKYEKVFSEKGESIKYLKFYFQ